MNTLLALFLAAQSDPGVLSKTAADDMRAGRYGAAAAKYEQLVKLLPSNAGIRMNLGLARYSEGQYEAAVEPLESAVKLDPKLAPAWLMLGMSHWKLNDPQGAVGPLEKAASLAPDNATAQLELADAYLATGRPEGALPLLEKLSGRNDPKALLGLGHTYAALSRQVFDHLPPDSAEAFALRGYSRLQAGQYAAALALYRQALKLNPALCGASQAIAEIYRAAKKPEWAAQEEARTKPCPPSGDYAKALEFSSRGAEAFSRLAALPPSPELHELRAEAHALAGEHASAIAELDAALAQRPGDQRLILLKVRWLWRSENCAVAVPLASKLGASAEREMIIGDCYLQQEQPKEAVAHLKKAVAADPNLLPAHASLGRSLHRLGEDAAAIPHFRAALSIDEDGALHLALSRALQGTGEKQQAEAMLAEYKRRSAEVAKPLEITPP